MILATYRDGAKKYDFDMILATYRDGAKKVLGRSNKISRPWIGSKTREKIKGGCKIGMTETEARRV